MWKELDIIEMVVLLRRDCEKNTTGRGELCFDLNAPLARNEGGTLVGTVQVVPTRVDVQIDHEGVFHMYVEKYNCCQGHETVCAGSMF
jgi:hypothetical protein